MMETINIVYTVLAIIFVCVMTWMFVYTRDLSARIRKLEASGHKIHSVEEGICLATLDKEQSRHRATHA
jgi:hypothetical protein